ncbi:MAG: DMT family transporter [Clostridiales Family XIII bacterium]|jgi:drug/metabolite transporter (DMT)-like permease|nr:DMT family transporter [Clostridiales Family XIII bacterium]
MNNLSHNRNIGFLFVLLTSLLYGLMPAVSQRAYAVGVTVETLLTGRYLIGGSLIWIYILLTKKNFKVGRGNFGFLMLVSVDLFGCAFFMNSSYAFIPGAVASLLVFCYIIIVNAVEMISGRERVYPMRILCLVLTVIGMVAVVYSPVGSVGLSIKGILFALSSGVLYAVWTICMGAKRLSGISSEVTMGYLIIVPLILNALTCISSGSPLLPQTPEQWSYIGYLGLSAGFIAPVAFTAAIKRIGASTASMINTSEPVFAYFAGILLMSDKLSWNATLGGVVIVAGLLLLNITERRRDNHL